MQRCAALRACLGERKSAVGKVECGEVLTACEFDFRGAPVQPAGDHQMKNEPKIALNSDRDSFTYAPYFTYATAFHIRYGWLRGAQQERVCDANALQSLTHDARLKRVRVGEDVG
jgi:hypothetical protein